MTVSRSTYAGLFLTTLSTLMYEILLTRIFSVMMWYHFAFMAISVAMFGLAVGGVLVYLLSGRLSPERLHYFLGATALLFAISIFLSFLIQTRIPYWSSTPLAMVSWTYLVTAVPFLFSGTCVCIALTKLPPENLGKLYAADLAGAAFGCALFVYVINIIDGPTAIVFLTFLAAAGAVLFLWESGEKRLRSQAVVLMFVFAAFTLIHAYLVSKQTPLLRLTWAKGHEESVPLYEKWNSFSRIQVSEDTEPEKPFGWGLSPVYQAPMTAKEMFIQIDSAAGTVLTQFNSMKDLEYLKFDIVNIVHYLRRDADVFVVGAGGGRDALSALVFDQKLVTAVEINPNILYAVNSRFGDFTRHLDRNPKVKFLNDEARSYLARSKGKFDIIQVSFIDTWAATAAGAFVLTENSLYTLEAWKIFLDRLKDGGILTFSRWYYEERPGEMYRLTALAAQSLMDRGISDPRKHIMIVRHLWKTNFTTAPSGIGTILISTTPFSDEDIARLNAVASQLRFQVAFSPISSLDPVFEKITSPGFHQFTSSFPIDITPPTDDRPFFFNMLRLSNIFEGDLMEQGANYLNMVAVYVLGTLLILILVLTGLLILLPLAITARVTGQKGVFPFFLFFAAIGAGFMLVEISLMQKLIVFLGHPTYSLSVVLFSLLLSAGLGSYSTQRIVPDRFVSSAILRFATLLLLLVIAGFLVPLCLHAYQGASTFSRILISVILLFPLGFFMGMAFPVGMNVSFARLPLLTPWFWGINGSLSVCASVISFAIALTSGISVAYWTGFTCYAIAFAAFLWAAHPRRVPIALETPVLQPQP